MANYSITFINRSKQNGSACLFQRDPDGAYNVFPLAWFTQFTPQGSQARFDWWNDYSFAWASTGQLRPGVSFNAAQLVDADPNGRNQIRFSGSQFEEPQSGGQPGTLGINTESSVRQGQVSIGVGVSGSPTFATQAQPNMMNVFNARAQYWVDFGDFQKGQVLDPQRMGNAVQVDFEGKVSAMTVTLNQDNTFTIQPA